MSTTHPLFTIQINAAPQVIFDLVADMPNYVNWLPGSDAFGGTTEVTPYPVRLNTTYLDAGPMGKRPGSVTEFDPPKHISFHHNMAIKKGLLSGNADVHIRYTFEPNSAGTFVKRQLDITIKMDGLSKLATPLVSLAFRKENVRLMAELKKYVEGKEYSWEA